VVKVIVQIPCLNEAATLPLTVAEIPRQIEGVDWVELLVIDDGSSDRTAEVARELGVEHVVRFRRRRGLARAFRRGLDEALLRGADIVINTDADNQYRGADIPKLVAPILAGRADMVIGDRQTDQLQHFSWMKRFLQRWGTATMRWISGTNVTDATSGFRAYSREAAMRVMVLSRFSYTLETILQAGIERLAIETVHVGVNAPTRPSRLFKSIPQYLRKSLETLIRIYTMYNPLRVYCTIGAVLFSIGCLIGLRFVVLYAMGLGDGRVQSLILAAVLLIAGMQIALIGLLADVIASNRKLIEDALYRLRLIEHRQLGVTPNAEVPGPAVKPRVEQPERGAGI
jgi:glycosyltransferase involved in cell wall biosynthesis